MDPAEALGCIVTWWHPELHQRVYQVYFGLLFGLPNAVTSFNRWSKLAEALLRRLLILLFSMYFDDGTMQDWACFAEESQRCTHLLMAIFGSPWAPKKSQRAAGQADFLGLLHNTTLAHTGRVSMWPRDTLVTKVEGILRQAATMGLSPGQASKLYGVVNFLELGMFGRIGQGGLNAIKERIHEATWEVTPRLADAFALLSDIFKMKPVREYTLFERKTHRVLMASDASYEAGVGKAGFLIISDPGKPTEERVGVVVDINALGPLEDLWGQQETYITQLELLTVIVALVECAGMFRNSRGLFFVDNVSALMAMVKGRSKTETLDTLTRLGHFASFALGASAYYEYVQSKSNWSDEISRLGLEGPWARQHGFKIRNCTFEKRLLRLPCMALCLVIGFL